MTDEERQICKAIVLGNMYGQSIEGMRRRLEIRLGRPFSESEANEYWEGVFAGFSGIKEWRDRLQEEFDKGSRETRTRLGRRRLDVTNKRQRWNAPIQGLATDALKSIAVEVYRWRDAVPGLEIVGLIHDEVICVVPEEDAEEAAKWLTNLMQLVGDHVVNGDLPEDERVPIEADTSVVDSWGEKG